MTTKTHKMNRFNSACAVAGVMFSLVAGSAAAAPVCQALVSANNDLFLLSPDGTVVTRFTTDAQAKPASVLAPDGSKVAFIADRDTQSVTVVNASGTSKTFQLKPSTDNLTDQRQMLGIRWRANSVLQVERHVSPETSSFDHYTIPADLSAAQQIQRPSLSGSPGTACSLAPVTVIPACVFGSEITVAGDSVYQRRPYDGTTPLENFTIPVGGTVSSSASESGFQITLVATNLGYYTLKVTFAEGASRQALVPIGKSMAFQVDGEWYGLIPTFVTGGAKVAVVKGAVPDGGSVFENAIAWRGQDAEVMTIERSATGKALSVMERSGTSNPPVWTSLGQGNFPISTAIDDMRFVSPNYALIHTASEYALYPVTITKPTSTTATVSVGTKATLPSTITFTPVSSGPTVTGAVQDWKCSGN